MGNQAADNLILAILSSGRDRMAAGDYSDAVSFLTTTVEAVEAKRETYSAYGMRLMPVYALRALALLRCAQVGSGAATLRRAQQDVLKAEGVLDEFGGGLPAGMLENLRTRVQGVLSGDDGIVAASMAGLRGEADGAFMAVGHRPAPAAFHKPLVSSRDRLSYRRCRLGHRGADFLRRRCGPLDRGRFAVLYDLLNPGGLWLDVTVWFGHVRRTDQVHGPGVPRPDDDRHDPDQLLGR